MKNFTEAINETTTTTLGQISSEETDTELLKAITKSVSDNVVSLIHLYGFIALISIGIFFNFISLIIFQKSQAFSSFIGDHLKCISITDSILLIGIVLTSSDEYWEEKIKFPNMLSLNNIYRPQRSWAKVMFLQASVILSTGGGSASVHAGMPAPPRPGRPPPRTRQTPLGPDIPPDQADPPRTRPPCPDQVDPPWEADASIRSMSGRYASYWNAFLFM